MPKTRAHAKLNLLLKVRGRRPDGYHELEMVNVSLDLADELEAHPAPALALTVEGGSEPLPDDDRNLAWRAAAALASPPSLPPAVHLSVKKTIPVGAGLAGGSTDAAAVLRLLGRGRNDLAAIALKLGADVPYCLDGRPALVTGIGEHIRPFVPGLRLHLVVANPGFAVSTKDIFTALDAPSLGEPAGRPEGESRGERLAAALAAARTTADLRSACALMENDLQPVTTSLHPAVGTLIAAMEETGALAVRMSGSGPTVFGIYPDEPSSRHAAGLLASRAPFVRAVSVLADPNGMEAGA